MHLDIARAMLQAPSSEDAWDAMTENVEYFIWTDNDTIRSWNEMAAEAKLPSVERRVEHGSDERVFLTYKNEAVQVPLTFSREDSLIFVHTLGWLVKRDSDIRYCLDSWHSSDKAFIALSPADWQALDSEFGPERVASRFLELPKNLQQFIEQAYADRA